MLHAFEITDATGQKLIEVPFSERLKDGRPLQRPRRPKGPRSKAMPGERRPKSGAVYYLQCSYRFVDERQGLAVETRGVKARDADAAIAAAQKICLDPSHMQLTSAFLFSPEGTIVWSKRVLREPIRWANATRGVPRFAQI